MTLYAIITDGSHKRELKEKIDTLFPAKNYELTNVAWLVDSDAAIPREITNLLGTSEGALGQVLVIRAAPYAAGWFKNTVWDWLRQKRDAAG